MSDLDRMRSAAVRQLETHGFRWERGQWVGGNTTSTDGWLAAADAMHDELSAQIEDLAGATEGSEEATQLQRLVELAQSYEAARPRD